MISFSWVMIGTTRDAFALKISVINLLVSSISNMLNFSLSLCSVIPKYNKDSKNKNIILSFSASVFSGASNVSKYGLSRLPYHWLSEWNTEWYFSNEGKLSSREKSLIALAVSHVVQCPYCIDAYTKDGLEKGIEKEEMMEAVHVGAAIKSGAVLVHGVQMMNRYNKLSM